MPPIATACKADPQSSHYLPNDVATYFAFHSVTNHNVLRLLGDSNFWHLQYFVDMVSHPLRRERGGARYGGTRQSTAKDAVFYCVIRRITARICNARKASAF